MTLVSQLRSGDLVSLTNPVSSGSLTVVLGKVINRGRSRIFEVQEYGSSIVISSIVAKIYDNPGDIRPDLSQLVVLAAERKLDEITPVVRDRNQNFTPVSTPLYTVCVDQRVVGVAMTRVPSRFVELSQLTASDHAADLRIGVMAAFQLARLVEEIHRRGFIVGDFSDNNVMVDEEGHVSLVDVDSYGVQATRILPHGVTQNWRAAEGRRQPLSQRSDLFTLGIHCSALLFGGVGAFDGVDPAVDTSSPQHNIDANKSWLWDTSIQIPTAARRSAGLRDLPNDLSTAVRSVLFHDPAERPQDASSLVRALSNSLTMLEKQDCGHIAFTNVGCVQCRATPVLASERVVGNSKNESGSTSDLARSSAAVNSNQRGSVSMTINNVVAVVAIVVFVALIIWGVVWLAG